MDPRLYLIVDDKVSDACITDAVDGGVTLVQLRAKTASTRTFVKRANEIKALLEHYKTPLFINDRIDVALASGAQGVHIGQEDMHVEDARRLLPDSMGLGLTVRTSEEAAKAPVALLDYISIGGVYPTDSKHNTTAPLGAEGLSHLVQQLRARRAPYLTAIAGINAQNIDEVMSCGVDGVAVISAVTCAASPAQAARLLRSAIDSALSTNKT